MPSFVLEISRDADDLIAVLGQQGEPVEVVETPNFDHIVELLKVIVPVSGAAFLTLRTWINARRDIAIAQQKAATETAKAAMAAVKSPKAPVVMVRVDGARIDLIACSKGELDGALARLEQRQ